MSGLIVLSNARDELAQGSVAFSVDIAARTARSTRGCYLEAPTVLGIPMLFRLCAFSDCRVHSAVHFILDPGHKWASVRVRFLRHADVDHCSGFRGN